MIRVVLPSHLRALAQIDGEVHLDITGPVTQRSVLDVLEACCPMPSSPGHSPISSSAPWQEDKSADSGPYTGPVDGVFSTAAEVMLTTPARHSLSATVGEIRDFFRDDHVHAVLIVGPAGYLEAVVERDDITECRALMLPLRRWDD
jgi:hypothetical protein